MPNYRDHHDLTPLYKHCKGFKLKRLRQYAKHHVKERAGLMVYIENAN
ncbi:MAG: hypothetical protein QXL54_03550 [Candidatus Bathyarchaeia archaeon]